jgi:hypothetical protein
MGTDPSPAVITAASSPPPAAPRRTRLAIGYEAVVVPSGLRAAVLGGDEVAVGPRGVGVGDRPGAEAQ